MPLNHLVERIGGMPDAVRAAAGDLIWSGSHIVGIGVDRPVDPEHKYWIYFPEPDVALLPGDLPVELLPAT